MKSAEEREAHAFARAVDARLAGNPLPQRRPKDLDVVIDLLATQVSTEQKFSPSLRQPSQSRSRGTRRLRIAVPLAFVLIATLVAVPVIAQKSANAHRVSDTVVIESTPLPRVPQHADLSATNPLEEVSLAEAQRRAGFNTPLPAYLPDGYTLKTVKPADAQKNNALSTGIMVRYGKGSSMGLDQDGLLIMYDRFVGSAVPCVLRNPDDGTRICAKYYQPAAPGSFVTDVTVGSIPAILIQSDSMSDLLFERDNMRISISGRLSATELMNIAASLR